MIRIKISYHGVIYSKKNSKRILINRRTGKSFIASSEKAKRMESSMADEFYLQGLAFRSQINKIKYMPVSIQIKIWEKDKTRRDLDNQATSILDGLVKSGIIQDDSINIVKKITIELAGFDKKDPRAEITIISNSER